MTNADGLDAYRQQRSAVDPGIALTLEDVASEPGFGLTTFAIEGARTIDGSVALAPDLMVTGLARVVDYFVGGMHATYGLSNLADPTFFLLQLRRIADALYEEMRRRTPASAVLDVSTGNARLERLVRALYPDAFADVDAPRASAAPPQYLASTAPVVVVGCPRSGTTWLQNLLQIHPSLAGPDGETCFFTSVRDLVSNRTLEGLVGHDRVVELVREFGATLFGEYQQNSGNPGTRLVEKTPSNVDHLDTIVELFPETSIVGIYRDGRDVVASLLAMPFGPEDPEVAAAGWARSVRRMLAFAANSDRLRLVRYEKLTADPVDEVVRLFRWLGLPDDPEMRESLRSRAGQRVSQHHVRAVEALSGRAERAVYRMGGDLMVELDYASDNEVRAMRRRPANVLDRARRGARRLVRNR